MSRRTTVLTYSIDNIPKCLWACYIAKIITVITILHIVYIYNSFYIAIFSNSNTDVEDTIDWDIYNARKDNWNKNQEQRHKHQQQKQAEENARQDAINHPKCPKCGSTAITSGQRGYSFFTGFLGSNKTVNRCANCGHTWKPGK